MSLSVHVGVGDETEKKKKQVFTKRVCLSVYVWATKRKKKKEVFTKRVCLSVYVWATKKKERGFH